MKSEVLRAQSSAEKAGRSNNVLIPFYAASYSDRNRIVRSVLLLGLLYSTVGKRFASPLPRAQHCPRLCGCPEWDLAIPHACRPFAL